MIKPVLVNVLVEDELKKFHFLCSVTMSVMPMFSEFIDNYWHEQIKSGESRELPFHDQSFISLNPIVISWIPKYELLFGKLSELWFFDDHGIIKKDMYDNYHLSGKVTSSFNCVGRIV
jgi:hypothetical protein